MKFQVYCTTHQTPVAPADATFHLLHPEYPFDPAADDPFKATVKAWEWWEIDFSDVWCPVSDDTHNFVLKVKELREGNTRLRWQPGEQTKDDVIELC